MVTMKDDYVTNSEFDSRIEIYDGKIKQYILKTQTELKSDFIQYFNDVIKNNKEDIHIITKNMNENMKTLNDKIDYNSKEVSGFKTLVIVALLAEILTRLIF